MRDPNRIPAIISLLSEVWENHPDLRLGQLIHIAANYGNGKTDVFLIEDEQMQDGLYAFNEQKP